MKRINFFIDEREFEILQSLSGTLSEHLRRAIHEYIRKIRHFDAISSESQERDTNE